SGAARPPEDVDEWQEAFEATLTVGEGGQLTYASPTLSTVVCPVPPGRYEVLVTGRGIVAQGWPGSTQPGDSWRLGCGRPTVTSWRDGCGTAWSRPGARRVSQRRRAHRRRRDDAPCRGSADRGERARAVGDGPTPWPRGPGARQPRAHCRGRTAGV